MTPPRPAAVAGLHLSVLKGQAQAHKVPCLPPMGLAGRAEPSLADRPDGSPLGVDQARARRPAPAKVRRLIELCRRGPVPVTQLL